MSWYSKVSKDITHLPECIDYFYKELDSARYEVKIHGSVEKASAQLPGIVEQRFNQLQELEAVLEYLNIELRRRKKGWSFRRNIADRNHIYRHHRRNQVPNDVKKAIIYKQLMTEILEKAKGPRTKVPNVFGDCEVNRTLRKEEEE